ncbi:MAG: hypothetical protein WBR18_06525 [Anaerolineales bacterium]
MPEQAAEVEEQAQEQEEETGMTEAERQRVLDQFEAKIESGGFAEQPFHNVVKEELYPLLGSGDLDQETFARLVRKWAKANNPHDWETRSYLDVP